jgi:hypothetical protein
MTAGEDGRLRVGRSFAPLRDLSCAPGWLQLAVTLALGGGLGFVALAAGLPARLAPLVIGGCLALLTALVTGSPVDDEPRDE